MISQLKRVARKIMPSFAVMAVVSALSSAAFAEDKLLEETLDFTSVFAYLQSGAPGLVMAAVRNGETAFAGYGETVKGSGKTPDADTIMRIGSISKVFCGATLANLVVEGKVALTDKLQDRLGYDVTLPEKDGNAIRLIDLVTHAAGLQREVPRPEAPASDPFSTNTKEAQIAALNNDPLLFAPGTGILYSNFGFDLLGAALANVSGKPYADLIKERIFAPLGMKDTMYNPRPGDEARLMQGHNFDGSPMPFAPTPATIECAGGMYTTANDMLRWMKWQLDRFSTADQEVRLIDQAAYLYRDGLNPVFGLDEGGEMDALGLAWVVMMPEENRPLILQKTGGLQGMFAYVAIAPARGVGVFVALNQFSVSGLMAAIQASNELITELSPR